MEQVAKQKKLVEEAAKAKAEVDAEAQIAMEEKEKAEKKLDAAQGQIKELAAKVSQFEDPEDFVRMEQQRPKIDNIIQKVETKKTSAAEQFKLGQYGDAVKAYQQAT